MITDRKRSQVRLFLEAVKKIIPEGRALPEKEWKVRHAGIVLLTSAHAFGLALFGLYRGYGLFQSAGEGSLIAAIVFLATRRHLSRSFRAAAASLGLVTASAILVQFSGGYIEAHFHFFVTLAVISLYQDWIPYLLSILFVAVEHGLTGQFVPTAVFNHSDAFLHPWKWAIIHAGFILGESIALLASWRIGDQVRARIDLVMNSAGEGIVGLDPERKITFANQAVASMTGYSMEALVGQPIDHILLDPVETPSGKGPALPSENEKGRPGFEKVVLRKDGSQLPVDSASNPIYEHGRVVGSVITLKDETDRKQAEEEREKTLSLLSATLESTADGILVVDKEGKITRFNQKFVEMWGVPEGIVASRNDDRALAYVLEQLKDPALFLQKVRELYTHLDVESSDLVEFKDGRIFERYSQPQRIGGESVGRVWSFRDITKRKQAEERLNYLANFDSVTGLPNRTLFYDRLTQSMTRAQWHQRWVAVLFFDLDRFKNINDTLGHAIGDLLLKDIAGRLSSCIREGDTVARLGGDEFVLILDDLAQPQDASKVAQKILEALEDPFHLEKRELFMSASIGIALCPEDGEAPETLLKNADTAMYRAKEQGRNNYQLYSPALNAKASERLTLENALRHALQREEILLHYQPKVDLATGEIVGMEALIRWKHPEAGLIPPSEFIPMAEETGLIIPIGEWVMRAACAQNKTWQEAGFPPVRIAVNLSARQFHRQNISQVVAQILKEVDLHPRYLELELTESIIMKNAGITVATLHDLDAMEIEMTIDDFGTGYSSLSYLKRFPIHTLKIDRSFVQDLSTDSDDAAIVTAIITLAHSLDLKVIAEGVETAAQLTFLRSLKCDQMQGYLFSRPLPPEEVINHWKEERRLI